MLTDQNQASVITTTSAAALAIPGFAGPTSYWMVNACFCAAFGVALEGLILVSYITIFASVVSDETIGLLAKGELSSFGLTKSRKPAATFMALPVIFTAYYSLFLLLGLAVMVGQRNSSESFDYQANGYHVVTLMPIAFGFVCMCITTLCCEWGTYQELKSRQEHLKSQRDIREGSQPSFAPLRITGRQGDLAKEEAQQGTTRHSRNDTHSTQRAYQLEGGHGKLSRYVTCSFIDSSARALKVLSPVRPTARTLSRFPWVEAQERPS